MFSDHGLCGLLEEGAHGKSPKCLGGNLGDFGEFCKGLGLFVFYFIQNILFIIQNPITFCVYFQVNHEQIAVLFLIMILQYHGFPNTVYLDSQ